MENQLEDWYVIDNEDDVFSPSLLVYPDRIEKNILNMIAIAGSAERLRPHVKTHKIPEIIRLQMNHGIRKFKCATIKNNICLDLGHKAIASEMPQPRAVFPDIEDAGIINHNEEHMVIKTKKADMLNIGDAVYAIPWHICPTVDRFEKVTVVNDGKATGQWKVEARKRTITI